MTVKEYSKKVDDLVKGMEGKVPGISVGENIGVSITNINGNPTLTFCEVDSQKNPTKLIYCISLENTQVVRRLELWLENAINIFKMKSLMDSDADIAVAGSQEEKSKEE